MRKLLKWITGCLAIAIMAGSHLIACGMICGILSLSTDLSFWLIVPICLAWHWVGFFLGNILMGASLSFGMFAEAKEFMEDEQELKRI